MRVGTTIILSWDMIQILNETNTAPLVFPQNNPTCQFLNSVPQPDSQLLSFSNQIEPLTPLSSFCGVSSKVKSWPLLEAMGDAEKVTISHLDQSTHFIILKHNWLYRLEHGRTPMDNLCRHNLIHFFPMTPTHEMFAALLPRALEYVAKQMANPTEGKSVIDLSDRLDKENSLNGLLRWRPKARSLRTMME